jgi:hypothetical protein
LALARRRRFPFEVSYAVESQAALCNVFGVLGGVERDTHIIFGYS